MSNGVRYCAGILLPIVLLGCATPEEWAAFNRERDPHPNSQHQDSNSPSSIAPTQTSVAPWVPPKADLILIGSASNIVSTMGKPVIHLLMDASEFRSQVHANFAATLVMNYHCSQVIGDAVNTISSWPEGQHKENAKLVIKWLSRMNLTLSKSIGLARSGQFTESLHELSESGIDSRDLSDAMIGLMSSVHIENWEIELKKQILIADISAKTLHRPECPILEQKTSETKESTKKSMEAAIDRLQSEPWGSDVATVKALFSWMKGASGSRGPCPIDLPAYFKEASLPTWLSRFVPVYVAHVESLNRCPSCNP